MAVRAKHLGFVKYHALGNDMILFDAVAKSGLTLSNRMAKKLCNRRFGIGGDQILILSKSRKKGADFRMQIFNSDGSESEMCGNGVRCVGSYIREKKYSVKKDYVIETLAGMRNVRIHSKGIEADLGEPILKGKDIPVNLSGRIINRPLKIDSKDFRITCLSLGNPHCVIFVENLDNFDVARFGPLLENYHLFPRRVNVSFVNIISREQLRMRIWERGAGETLACGTGAGAALVASVLNGFTERAAKVELPGGTLDVTWVRETNVVTIRGPVESVFEGTIIL